MPPRAARSVLDALSAACRAAAAACLLATFSVAAADSQSFREDFWMPNGEVSAMALQNNVLYLGGSFTRVGPPTGGFVAVDATSGQALSPYPLVNGSVLAMAADGNGGWYIGGAFDAVHGQPRQNLARLDAAGNLMPWNPGADGVVEALVRDPVTGVVYAGGGFANVGGESRHALAGVDGTTGLVTTWFPNPAHPSIPVGVHALALSGGTLYAGGLFATIGGQSRNNLAAFQTSGGLLTGWNPNADQEVYAIAVRELDTFPFTITVFVGGAFTNVGGQGRAKIAAIDGGSGLATSWAPGADGLVRSLVLTGGVLLTPLTVHAAGDFNTLGGQPRHSVAAIDASGIVTSWNPAPDQSVSVLAAGGNLIYASGNFKQIGGQSRNYLAALDPAGLATGWDPAPNSPASAIQVFGSSVIVGGRFSSVGGPVRNHLAAIDVATGMPTSWNPNVDGRVNAVVASAGAIYAGGLFSSAGGQARNHVAALDVATGAALGWNPDPNGEVHALAIRPVATDRNLIYMGGGFTTVGGVIRNRLAAMDDAPFPALSSWNPNLNGVVQVLLVDGPRIYAGGTFDSFGPPWANLVALRLDGSVDGLFAAYVDGPVRALATDGPRVYVGGLFDRAGLRDRQNFALLDIGGKATTWDPYADDQVRALAVQGSTLYAGGTFTSLGGSDRAGLGAVDLTNGLIAEFNPSLAGPFQSMLAGDGALYVGGSLPGLVVHRYLGAFSTGMVSVAGVPPRATTPELRLSSNPFREQLGIRFGLGEAGTAVVAVYDAGGRRVRLLPLGELPAGEHRATWDGRDDAGRGVRAGVYFVRVETAAATRTAKVVRSR